MCSLRSAFIIQCPTSSFIDAAFRYRRYRARQLGLPPPSLPNPFANSRSSRGASDWLQSKWDAVTRMGGKRSGGRHTAVDGTRPNPRGRAGFDPLDPDGAWDTRVDHEATGGAFFEEQELGLHDPSLGPYGGGGYGNVGARVDDRQRELDDRYDKEMHANPFGDTAERSSVGLRSMSPRPEDGHPGQAKKYSGDSPPDSPSGERRSVFRENV